MSSLRFQHGQETACPAASAPCEIPGSVSSVCCRTPAAEPIPRPPLPRDRGSLRRREGRTRRSGGIERRAPGYDRANACRARCRDGAGREGIAGPHPARHSARRNKRGPAPRQRPAEPLTRHGGNHAEIQRDYQPHSAAHSQARTILEAQRPRTGGCGARWEDYRPHPDLAAPRWPRARGCGEVPRGVRRDARAPALGSVCKPVAGAGPTSALDRGRHRRSISANCQGAQSQTQKDDAREGRPTSCNAK